MLLTSAFSKENPAISLDECVVVYKVFTTATRKVKEVITSMLPDKRPKLGEKKADCQDSYRRWGIIGCRYCDFFFFCVPQLDLWGSPYWVRFFRM